VNKDKNILIYLRDLAPWGHKHIILTLSKIYNVKLILTHKPDNDLLTLIYETKTDIIIYKPNIWIRNLEEFLIQFVNKIQTTNYKYGIKRTILSLKGLSRLKLNFSYWFVPKILSSTLVSKILGLIPSEFDDIIKSASADCFIFQAFLIPYHYLPARANRIGLKIYSLIYSWDNPFKYNFLPNYFTAYLIWNDSMREDLRLFHKINYNNQYIIGPMQFDYLKHELQYTVSGNDTINFINKNKNNYALYLFSMAGTAAKQEVQLFKHICDLITKIDPKLRILARPYPNTNNPIVYDEIKELSYVFVDKSMNLGLKQVDKDIYIKKLSISNAKYIINSGTTMALEASLFNKPVLQIAYLPKSIIFSRRKANRPMDIDYICKNDHLKKYLFREDFPNVAFNDEQIKSLAYCLLKEDYKNFISFTAYLRSLSEKSIHEEAALNLLEKISNLNIEG
jgi:hypothetical protein